MLYIGIMFFNHYCFDPPESPQSLAVAVYHRCVASDSIKHAMMGTAALLRSYYDLTTPPARMLKQSEAFAATADKLLCANMQNPEIPLVVKLEEVSELMCYHVCYLRLHPFIPTKPQINSTMLETSMNTTSTSNRRRPL
jgi:hypothetical protein